MNRCLMLLAVWALCQIAMAMIGLPYFNPHSFRDALVHLGMNDRLTPEQMKAISQNLGHEKLLTTVLNYGEVAYQRQGEIIRGLAAAPQAMQAGVDEIAEAIFKKLRDSGMKTPI